MPKVSARVSQQMLLKAISSISCMRRCSWCNTDNKITFIEIVTGDKHDELSIGCEAQLTA